MPPSPPPNPLLSFANTVNSVISMPMQAVNLVNEGFASATNFISQALPTFSAATKGSIAAGLPHAHTLHPPSGPPPVPPTPIPPVGPIQFGNCVQVLINGKPAARAGDLGLNPTCCGLPPIFEIITGSSKVFIGGSRAARRLDVTYHCKMVSTGGAVRGAAKALRIAMRATMAAGMAAQVASIAGYALESFETDQAALSEALALNAEMMAKQLAEDAVGMAAGAAMGKDLCVPPGTLGAIVLDTSSNVEIGGFPMPAWAAIARGLLKRVKGLKMRRGGKQGRSGLG
jgi:uncharacterized Zn-binding protein involved in type VI secretion